MKRFRPLCSIYFQYATYLLFMDHCCLFVLNSILSSLFVCILTRHPLGFWTTFHNQLKKPLKMSWVSKCSGVGRGGKWLKHQLHTILNFQNLKYKNSITGTLNANYNVHWFDPPPPPPNVQCTLSVPKFEFWLTPKMVLCINGL